MGWGEAGFEARDPFLGGRTGSEWVRPGLSLFGVWFIISHLHLYPILFQFSFLILMAHESM